MIKLSDYKEEDQTEMNARSSPTKPSETMPFNAVLDQSNPPRFLEAAFEFAAPESNLFKSHSVIKDVNALVRVYKVKPATAPLMKEVAEKSKEDEKITGANDDEDKGPRAPNKANGLDLPKYSWGQTLKEVTACIPVPSGTKSRSIVFELTNNHLKVGLMGQPSIIDGELCQPVKVDDCFWSLEDQQSLSVLLTKHNQMEWWKSLVKGDDEIDTQRVEPENSYFADFDETEIC